MWSNVSVGSICSGAQPRSVEMDVAAKQPTRHTRPRQSKRLWDSKASMNNGVSRISSADLLGPLSLVASSDGSCSTTEPSVQSPPLWWPWISPTHNKSASICTNANVLLLLDHCCPDDKAGRETAGLGNNIIIPSSDKCKPAVRNPPTWSLHPFPTVPRLGNKAKAHRRTFSVYREWSSKMLKWSYYP